MHRLLQLIAAVLLTALLVSSLQAQTGLNEDDFLMPGDPSPAVSDGATEASPPGMQGPDDAMGDDTKESPEVSGLPWPQAIRRGNSRRGV